MAPKRKSTAKKAKPTKAKARPSKRRAPAKTKPAATAPVEVQNANAAEDEYLATLAELDAELDEIERKLRTGRKMTKVKVDVLKERRMLNAAKRASAKERYERLLVRDLMDRDQVLQDQVAAAQGKADGAARLSQAPQLPSAASREAN